MSVLRASKTLHENMALLCLRLSHTCVSEAPSVHDAAQSLVVGHKNYLALDARFIVVPLWSYDN